MQFIRILRQKMVVDQFVKKDFGGFWLHRLISSLCQSVNEGIALPRAEQNVRIGREGPCILLDDRFRSVAGRTQRRHCVAYRIANEGGFFFDRFDRRNFCNGV